MNDFDINDSLGYLVSNANALIRLSFTHLINEKGLNATAEQWGILNVVKVFPGLTQSEIAEKVIKDKTNVTRMLDVLEKNGNIERQADKKDRRAHRIFITSEGEKLLDKLTPLASEINEIGANGTDKEDIRVLKDGLKKIIDNLINK